MAADDNEIGQLQIEAEQLDADRRPCLNDFLVPPDRREAVSAAERGDAAGPLAHWVRRKPFAWSLHQSNKEILGTPNLAVDLDSESGGYNRSFLRAAARE